MGDRLTLEADFFALGAMMWEMLAGYRLLGKMNFGELMQTHLEWVPPNVQRRLPEVSRELAAVIETCLAHDPQDRKVNLSELAQWAAPFTAYSV
jgi:hypothetical protein